MFYGYLDEIIVPPVEVQARPLKETSQESDISPARASQMQDTSKIAVETGKVGHEADGNGNDGESYPDDSYGLFKMALPRFCWLHTAQL